MNAIRDLDWKGLKLGLKLDTQGLKLGLKLDTQINSNWKESLRRPTTRNQLSIFMEITGWIPTSSANTLGNLTTGTRNCRSPIRGGVSDEQFISS